MQIPEMERENPKKFPSLKIIAFESGTTSSLNLEKDTCHWQSMCYETSLRFNISRREIFFKSGSIRVMEKYDERDPFRIYKGLGSINMSSVKRSSKTVFLKLDLTRSFTACNFRNKVAMTIIFFFKIIEIICRFQKWIEKTRKSFWF